MAKFRHFGNILKVFGDYVTAYFVLVKILNLLWSTFYAIGRIFIAANGLILKNNLAIWSHWTRMSVSRSVLHSPEGVSYGNDIIAHQLVLLLYNFGLVTRHRFEKL